MSKYDKKEPTERQVIEAKIKSVELRLWALQRKLDSAPLEHVEHLLRLRNNLQYRKRAFEQRLSTSTKKSDVMEYNIKIVQTV